MTSTRDILNNLIPTEIPVLPPDATLDELETAEGRNKVTDKFNQLHFDFLAEVLLMQNTLHMMSLDVINIIIDYFKVDHLLLAQYEKYRQQGIRDIALDQFIMLAKKEYYPLLLSYNPAGICLEEIRRKFSPDELQDSRDMIFTSHKGMKPFITTYVDANNNIRNSGVFAVYKDQVGYRDDIKAFYPEGMTFVDDIEVKMWTFDSHWGGWANLEVIKIPPDCVAKVKIQNITYQLMPYEYSRYRVFDSTGVDSNHTKIWRHQTPIYYSSWWGAWFRCCRRKKARKVVDVTPKLTSQVPSTPT